MYRTQDTQVFKGWVSSFVIHSLTYCQLSVLSAKAVSTTCIIAFIGEGVMVNQSVNLFIYRAHFIHKAKSVYFTMVQTVKR